MKVLIFVLGIIQASSSFASTSFASSCADLTDASTLTQMTDLHCHFDAKVIYGRTLYKPEFFIDGKQVDEAQYRENPRNSGRMNAEIWPMDVDDLLGQYMGGTIHLMPYEYNAPCLHYYRYRYNPVDILIYVSNGFGAGYANTIGEIRKGLTGIFELSIAAD